MIFGEKAQASITDALFILTIVSVLAIGMFSTSLSYGRSVETTLSGFYNEDYVTSALQTLLNTSVPRAANEDLKTAREVDSLLAKMKEDYANTGTFSEDTKLLIKRTLDTVMSPRMPYNDYILYFWTPQDYPANKPSGSKSERFIFVYLKISEINEETGAIDKKAYFCEPALSFREMADVLLERAPEAAKARSVTMVFTRFVPTDIYQEDVVIFAGLIMWHSVGILPGKEDETILGAHNLNCKLVS
jgi:hypothetical protein